MARTLRRKNLVSRRHVTLAGPAVLSGQACVGGNLTVEGDLTIDGELLCMGRITVRGTLRAGSDIVAGRGMEVHGSVRASAIEVFSTWDEFPDMEEAADAIARYLPEPPTDDDGVEVDAVARLVDDDTFTDIVGTGHIYALLARSVDCIVIRAKGAMRIDGSLDCSIVDALGMPLEVGSLYVDDDLTCGLLEVAKDAGVGGDLYCVGLACDTLQLHGSAEVVEALRVRGPDMRPADGRHADGTPFDEIDARGLERLRPGDLMPSLTCVHLKAGSIEVRGSLYADGALHCDGHLRADLGVTACEGLTTGPHHGVMAGLGVPTGLWHTLGCVSAPGPRPRVLTGEFRPLGRRGRDGTRRPVGARRAR
jgi:hypothetical protein